jgi:hypothetical protein
MMIEVDRYLAFLEEHDLVPQQFLLLECLMHNNRAAIIKYKKLFPIEDNTMIGKILFDELVQKEFIEIIESKNKKEPQEDDEKRQVMASHLRVTKKFSKLYTDKWEAADQIKEIYPAFLKSDGKVYPLTLWSEDTLRETYWKKIKGLHSEHLEVIEDITYALKHNLIKGKLQNFVESRAWLELRKIRKGEVKVSKRGIEPAKL